MAGEMAAEATGRRLASGGGLELVVPECAKGIGAVIGEVDSQNLIAGVRVERYAIHADDRGYFLEVQRLGAPSMLTWIDDAGVRLDDSLGRRFAVTELPKWTVGKLLDRIRESQPLEIGVLAQANEGTLVHPPRCIPAFGPRRFPPKVHKELGHLCIVARPELSDRRQGPGGRALPQR